MRLRSGQTIRPAGAGGGGGRFSPNCAAALAAASAVEPLNPVAKR